MDMTLIQGTITGLKTAADIAKSLMELKSISDVQAKVIELQTAILSAQSSALSANADQSAMVDELRKLKEEITRIKAWEAQKQRYKLVAPWSGGVAYALRQSMSNSEPPHLICTNCYESGRKSILNPISDSHAYVSYACPVCKSQIPTGYRGTPTPEYAPD
jgi:hypothetical protein